MDNLTNTLPVIEGAIIDRVYFKIKKPSEEFGTINIGALYLKCEDRDFILDTTTSEYYNDTHENNGEILCRLEVDPETFEWENGEDEGEYKYNLTAQDLLSKNLKAEIFVGCYKNLPFDIFFDAHINGTTHTIPVTLEEGSHGI